MKPETNITSDDALKLAELISGAEAAETDEALLERIRRDYPYFTLADLLALRGDASASERADAAAQAAMSGADPAAVERLAEPDGTRFDDFYPADVSPKAPTTNQAIDKFLETFGHPDPDETATLEKLIFNPVADYSQQLARSEETSLPTAEPTGNSQDDRINRFILSVRGGTAGEHAQHDDALETLQIDVTSPAAAAVSEAAASRQPRAHKAAAPTPAPDENSLLSESLAKIYIKTHRYERAYEILSRLSLAFPEKNAYFADQLRFLRKLIFIEKHRKGQIPAQTESE